MRRPPPSHAQAESSRFVYAYAFAVDPESLTAQGADMYSCLPVACLLLCNPCALVRERVPKARFRAAPDSSGPCGQQQQQQSMKMVQGYPDWSS
jgi:hypothetical protein